MVEESVRHEPAAEFHASRQTHGTRPRRWHRVVAALLLVACRAATSAGADPSATIYTTPPPAADYSGWHLGFIGDTSRLHWFFGAAGYSLLDHADFALAKNRGALGAELYSDYVYPLQLLGYARAGLGVLFQSTKDTLNAANERMFNAGGNAYLYFGLPLLSYAHYADGKEQARLSITLSPRMAVDVPAMGGQVDQPSFNLDLSVDIETRMRTFSNVLQLFGAARYGRRSGPDSYYRQLGHDGQGAFFLGTWQAGFIVASIFRLGVARTFVAPEEMQRAIPLTFTVRIGARSQ